MQEAIKRLSDICEITGLSKTSIYRMMDAGNFPKSVKLGARSVGWLQSELDAWISNRVEQSRN